MDIKEINEEIDKLEKCEYTTYGNCYKLAALYTIRDHMNKDKKVNEAPMLSMPPLMK